jgi:hypothetical protein
MMGGNAENDDVETSKTSIAGTSGTGGNIGRTS